MQILNKGYIIKAAHSTCCTIAVLSREMDYSYNKRRGRPGERDLQHNQLVTEKGEHKWEWRHRPQRTFRFNALFENLQVRIRFHKSQALCAITSEQFLFKKLSTLASLCPSPSVSVLCTLWLSRIILLKLSLTTFISGFDNKPDQNII